VLSALAYLSPSLVLTLEDLVDKAGSREQQLVYKFQKPVARSVESSSNRQPLLLLLWLSKSATREAH